MSLENEIDEENVEQETIDESNHNSVDSAEEPNSEIPNKEPAVEDAEATDEEQDTFPRDYVEKLRDENAKYRQRAQKADDLAHRLHNALTAATGRLADPSDLPYEESHLDDPEALQRAIQELLEKKPHLGSRKPVGNIGQGVSSSTDAVDLAAMMRARA